MMYNADFIFVMTKAGRGRGEEEKGGEEEKVTDEGSTLEVKKRRAP